MRNSRQITYTIEKLISAILEKQDISEIRQIILGVEDINQPDNDRRTALHCAVLHNNLEMVRVLIAHGADASQDIYRGGVDLFWPAQNNNLEMVRVLIAHGADVSKGIDGGGAAVFCAAFYNNLKMVREFITHGADVNQPDNNRCTALFVAASNNNLEMVRELLIHGADVNQANNDGKTAIHWAAKNNNLEMVRVLIAHGADESCLDENKKTQFKEVIAEGKDIYHKNNYLVKLVERKTILDQGQRSNDSNLSKLPIDVINHITEFSLDAKIPSNVKDKDIKTAIQYGEDKFSYKLSKQELENPPKCIRYL